MTDARVPRTLAKRPFLLRDANRAGLERWHLEGQEWRRVGPRTYMSSRIAESAAVRIDAAALRLPKGGAFSGLTAAWLHGLDVNPCDPIEITVPISLGVAARSGMRVRRAVLADGEVVSVKGHPATSVTRTIRDISTLLSLTEAVVICDMALHAGLTNLSELHSEVAKSSGARGITTLRRALEDVEPASESPMETRLRMLLVLAGLPRPEAQVAVRDRWLRVIGRPDLFYRDHRLGLEYDGATHEHSLAEDNRRQNRLLDAGVRLLRFTAADIYQTPEIVAAQVRAALSIGRVHALA